MSNLIDITLRIISTNPVVENNQILFNDGIEDLTEITSRSQGGIVSFSNISFFGLTHNDENEPIVYNLEFSSGNLPKINTTLTILNHGDAFSLGYESFNIENYKNNSLINPYSSNNLNIYILDRAGNLVDNDGNNYDAEVNVNNNGELYYTLNNEDFDATGNIWTSVNGIININNIKLRGELYDINNTLYSLTFSNTFLGDTDLTGNSIKITESDILYSITGSYLETNNGIQNGSFIPTINIDLFDISNNPITSDLTYNISMNTDDNIIFKENNEIKDNITKSNNLPLSFSNRSIEFNNINLNGLINTTEDYVLKFNVTNIQNISEITLPIKITSPADGIKYSYNLNTNTINNNSNVLVTFNIQDENNNNSNINDYTLNMNKTYYDNLGENDYEFRSNNSNNNIVNWLDGNQDVLITDNTQLQFNVRGGVNPNLNLPFELIVKNQNNNLLTYNESSFPIITITHSDPIITSNNSVTIEPQLDNYLTELTNGNLLSQIKIIVYDISVNPVTNNNDVKFRLFARPQNTDNIGDIKFINNTNNTNERLSYIELMSNQTNGEILFNNYNLISENYIGPIDLLVNIIDNNIDDNIQMPEILFKEDTTLFNNYPINVTHGDPYNITAEFHDESNNISAINTNVNNINKLIEDLDIENSNYYTIPFLKLHTEQEAAEKLGFDQTSWDNQGTNGLPQGIPADYNSLTEEQQAAAMVLHHGDITSWTGIQNKSIKQYFIDNELTEDGTWDELSSTTDNLPNGKLPILNNNTLHINLNDLGFNKLPMDPQNGISNYNLSIELAEAERRVDPNNSELNTITSFMKLYNGIDLDNPPSEWINQSNTVPSSYNSDYEEIITNDVLVTLINTNENKIIIEQNHIELTDTFLNDYFHTSDTNRTHDEWNSSVYKMYLRAQHKDVDKQTQFKIFDLFYFKINKDGFGHNS